MNLLEIFQQVKSNYYLERKKGDANFKNNYLLNLVNHEALNAIPQNIIGNQYIVKASVGQGRWAIIPWVAVFNKEISTSAQSGCYIVFLFTSDGKGVYLSLNQGWTYYEKNFKKTDRQNNCREVVRFWRRVLTTISRNFSLEEMDLIRTNEKRTKLAEGYQNGNICSKYYEIEKLNDNNKLLEDLNEMMAVYSEISSYLIKNKYENYEALIENILLGKQFQFGNKSNQYEKIRDMQAEYLPTKGIKRDYIKELEQNIYIGDIGEQFVFNLERKKVLKDPYLAKYVDEVVHISKEKGDGLGYDIVSIIRTAESGYKKIYIEVKSTKGEAGEQFFITKNEIEVASKLADAYYIYRVYKVLAGEPMYKVIQAPFEGKINLSVCTYSAEL
ncbi:MrcB family domain-containing protein [Listeria costaricensis]|uniref:MrcB family domain-containing protein n=1 Tax=Listeria costaricensis TaxID=2026604 RepID=UPI000C06CC9F|nr:DUF3578 domain-containing protein [Listeria costaricensis]